MEKRLIILLGLIALLISIAAGPGGAKDKPAKPEFDIKYFQDQVGIGLEVKISTRQNTEAGEIILYLESKGLKLTPAVAANLGLDKKESDKVNVIFGDNFSLQQTFEIEAFESDWDFMFKESKRKVMGSLGLQGITSHRVCLDFKNNKLIFIERPKEKQPEAGKTKKKLPETDLISGNKIKVVFQNGTEAQLDVITWGGKQKAEKQDGQDVIYGLPIVIKKELVQKIGLQEDTLSVWPTPIEKPPVYVSDIKSGNIHIKKAQVKMLADGFTMGEEETNGFIGPAFLQDYKATFDFQQNKLLLE